MQPLEIVAWWGAIVATTVLVWDIIKWLRSGPKIRASAVMPTTYNDSKAEGIETKNGTTETTYTEFCHIEVINSGVLPTTILEFTITHKKNKASFNVSNSNYTPTLGYKLPQVLHPGGVWMHRVEIKTIRRMAKMGEPLIKINLSHKVKPLIIKVDDRSNKIKS